MVWLPRPTYQERKEAVLFQGTVSSLLFSEFLSERNVLFFPEGTGKAKMAEALVRSFPSLDAEKALADMWERERDGALLVPPDVSILRARLGGLLHVQVAAGISPSQVVLVLVAPVERLRIHLRFLVEISSLFRDARLVETLRRLKSPRQVIRALREAESGVRESPGAARRLRRLFSGLFLQGALS